MQPEGAAAAAGDEGFSPLRVARAGRRAGQHAAIQEPGSSSGVPDVSSTPQAGPLQQARQLQHQGSSSQQRVQQDGASASVPSSSSTEQQEPQQPEQDSSQPAAAAPPPKRVGFSLDLGAGDAAAARQQNFTGVSRRKQEQLQKEQQAEVKQRNKYDDKLVDAMVDVPELEEEGKEDITRIVAQAPKSTTPQVQRISELEPDQAWAPNQAARSTDINLSLLTSCLLPSAQVVEPSEVWDYSLLFSQLKAELQNEAAALADSSASGAYLQDDPVPA